MTLRELGRTPGYGMTDDGADIRGWRALADDGHALGAVDELIVDPARNVVHYAVVRLEGDRRVLWPAYRLGYREAERAVVLEGLTPDVIGLLRDYAGEDSLQSPAGEDGGPLRLALQEERLAIGKRRVKKGELTVTKHVQLEDVHEDVTLYDEDVEVTRRPVDRPATEADRVVTEGDVTIVPVIAERLVIEKRPYVVEEIVITRKPRTRVERVEEQLRREEATIEEPPTA